ncbi:DEKNAAC100367 [Brettanomyces naardenensis]|uniref:DEKNAAC100367 n=1 Tax=Brettanomyces naardenensis TaxID=13370 RepID=A0A448YFB8_BRENA|nr:DEKNAAC100367 [Brettanomyces naardenensis]
MATQDLGQTNVVDSENTPLISSGQQNNRSKNCIKRYRLDVWIPIVILSGFLIAVVITFVTEVLPNIGQYVAEGTTFKSKEVDFLGFSDEGGVNFEVIGSSHNNFSQIDQGLARAYFKFGGFFVRKLNLKVDDLDLMVYDEENDDYEKLGRVRVSPFTASIVDGSRTEVDLFMKVFPNSKGLLGTIEKVLADPDSKLKLEGDANVEVLVLNGYIPLTHVIIPLDIDIPTSLLSRPSADNVSIADVRFLDLGHHGSKSMKCLFDVLLSENPIRNLLSALNLPAMKVPSSTWDILIENCDGKASTDVASLRTSNFILDNEDSYNISCSLGFDSDVDKLTEKCNGTDYSPFSKFIDGIVENGTMSLVLAGEETSNVPEAVSNVLKMFTFPLNIPLNVSEVASKVVKTVTMEDTSFGLENGTPAISGDLKVVLNFSRVAVEGFEFKDMKGTADLNYHGGKFADVNISDWRPTTTKVYTDDSDGSFIMVVSCRLEDVLLNITDMDLFQRILTEVMQNGVAQVEIKALVDVLIGALLGEFELDSVPGSGTADFSL